MQFAALLGTGLGGLCILLVGLLPARESSRWPTGDPLKNAPEYGSGRHRKHDREQEFYK